MLFFYVFGVMAREEVAFEQDITHIRKIYRISYSCLQQHNNHLQ